MAELKMDFAKMADGFTKTAKEKGMFVGWWIPVSERLPEDGEDVLVYIERNAWDEDGLEFRKKCIDIGWQIDGRWHCDGCNGVVGIAWMPLPQPYEPQESEVEE